MGLIYRQPLEEYRCAQSSNILSFPIKHSDLCIVPLPWLQSFGWIKVKLYEKSTSYDNYTLYNNLKHLLSLIMINTFVAHHSI